MTCPLHDHDAARAVERLTDLYAPTAAYLVAQLPDLADGLHAVLMTLHADPHESASEMAAIRLEGVRRHCLRLADALRREERGK